MACSVEWTAKYDERGNKVEEAYFGTDGKPVINNPATPDGPASTTTGGIRSNSYFGIDGKPVLDTDGVARWTAKYDDRGNEVEEAYFGTDGKACAQQIRRRPGGPSSTTTGGIRSKKPLRHRWQARAQQIRRRPVDHQVPDNRGIWSRSPCSHRWKTRAPYRRLRPVDHEVRRPGIRSKKPTSAPMASLCSTKTASPA